MKQKFTLALLFLALAFISKGQSLAGTFWDVYAPGTPAIYAFTMHFTTDSVEISLPPAPAFVISSYTQSGSTFTITDKPGVSNCGTVPGQYTISIANDTLEFDNDTDTCSERKDVLEDYIFVRAGLNVAELALQKAVKLYPNPALDFVKLDFAEDVIGLSYTITNTYGQTVFKSTIETTNERVELSSFSAGMYFLRIEGFTTSGLKFVKY
jgi:hypothetical protein